MAFDFEQFKIRFVAAAQGAVYKQVRPTVAALQTELVGSLNTLMGGDEYASDIYQAHEHEGQVILIADASAEETGDAYQVTFDVIDVEGDLALKYASSGPVPHVDGAPT